MLYLLRMSQKLKNINLYLPHERERTSGSREKQTFHIFWALLKLPFKIGDPFTSTIITIAQAQVNCNQAIVLAYSGLLRTGATVFVCKMGMKQLVIVWL